MRDWLLKTRLFFSDKLLTLVIVCLVVAALGGWLTYTTHVDTGEKIVQNERTWTTEGAFDHQSTVAVGTSPFEEGERVSDRPLYFSEVMPELSGSFMYTHTGDGELDVSIELDYIVREIKEEDENEEIIWQTNRSLATERATMEDGEGAAVEFEVDVNETAHRAERIQKELGGSPGTTEAVVRAGVTGEGTINGEPVDIDETHELSISPDVSTYSVTGEGGEQTYTNTERSIVETTHGPLRTGGSLLLLILPLFALGGLGIVHFSGNLEPRPGERQLLAQREERAEFEDWISTGRLSPDLLDRNRVDVDSLEDLVDIAIDSDRRVILDDERGAYFVVEETVLYVYEPPVPVRTGPRQEQHRETPDESETGDLTAETAPETTEQSIKEDGEGPSDESA